MNDSLTPKPPDSYEAERGTLIVSLTFVLVLMVWGLVFSELTTSNIIEIDAAAYIISGIIGLVTIFVSRLQEKPSSDKHPLGYSGFIPILNMIRNLMIIEICINAISSSIGTLAKGPPEHATLFLYASVTLLFNLSCAIYTHKAAKRLNSPLLKTDALEWRLDTVYNISILGAFSLAFILDHIGYAAHAAYVDPIVYIFFSIYMCISPSKLFFENMQILSVGSVDKKTHSHLVSLFKKEIPVFKTHATHFTIFTEDIFDVTEKCQAILNQTYPNNKLSYTYHLEA